MADVWSDSPITSKADDSFGRSRYAIEAAKLIASSHSWDDSIVFGLTGAWGSGKSSMLAKIAEEFADSHKPWKIAKFTPWATGDVGGLLGDFYASLSEVLPKNRGRQARKALGTLAEVSAPAANLIPIAGGAVASVAASAGGALKQRLPWDKAFREASERLRQLETPVLMIADDIDRLQTDELLALLRVVRLLGRFKGVHYLLAYDEATLFQALSAANLVGGDGGAASLFMEKIVQYPLVVPPLLPTQLLRRLDVGIDSAFAEAGRPAIESPRLGQLEEVYRSVLATPRAIDRYVAQLRHHLPLLPGEEIDDEDVVVLTLLRTAFPTVYGQLPRWRKELISGHTAEMKRGTSGVEFESFDVNLLVGALPANARPPAVTLLLDLFPKLRAKGSFGYGGSGERRIWTDPYFDRYFAMGVPDHDVSDAEVRAAVDRAVEGSGDALAGLLTLPDVDRLELVIMKGFALTGGFGDSESADASRLRIVRTIAGVLDQVPTRRAFLLDPRERVIRWAGQLIGDLSNAAGADQVAAVLKAFPRLADRLAVIHVAGRDRESGSSPDCIPAVLEQLGVDAADALITNIQLRDEAPLDEGVGWMTHFLASTGFGSRVLSRIEAGLDGGDFSLADVAARFISTRTYLGTGGGPHLGDPNQEAYNALVPPREDAWYSEPQKTVDDSDLSWENRRRYAAGRIRPPEPGAS